MFLKISFCSRLMCQLCKVALIWLFTSEHHCPALQPYQCAVKASGSCSISSGSGNREGGGPKCILCFQPVVQFTAPPDDHARAVNTYMAIWLNYCNSLSTGLLHCALQVVLEAAAHRLTDWSFVIISSLLPPVKQWID